MTDRTIAADLPDDVSKRLLALATEHMNPRELRLRARIDQLLDRIEGLEELLDNENYRERIKKAHQATYEARCSRDMWKQRALEAEGRA